MADADPLSKNEQKRRQKAEKKANEKAEKEAKKVAEAIAKGETEKRVENDSEEEMTPNEYFKIRSAAVETFKQGPIHPYPHKFHVNISLTEFIETYSSLEAGLTKDEGKTICTPKESPIKIPKLHFC